MRDEIIKIAKDNLCDIVGFASKDRFDKNDAIFKIFPETKTVICLAFRILRGIYRGTEEGTTYFQYTTMAVGNMEETVMPMAQFKVANVIEEAGFIALPQRRHQQIMAEEDGINPEVDYNSIYHNITQETQMDFTDAAIKCGIGEKGLSGAVLTDEYGPMVRYCFILTDAEIEETEIQKPHLCDNCKKCVNACPGKAISDEGIVDNWQCAVYYKGANGTKNPFMPKDAYADFEDRIKIISGEIKVTPEKAKKILEATYFYPRAPHKYTASICGRACDTACYMHLEEQGKLEKKFKRPFRNREEWKFDIKDFE